MSWGEIAEKTGPKFKSNRISLSDDGDKTVGVICGEPVKRVVVWVNGKPEEYDEEKHGQENISVRMKMNFCILPEFEMKTLEVNWTTYKLLKACVEKYGVGHVFEVARHGAKGDTRPSYTVFPERKLEEDEAERIRNTATHRLEPDKPEGSDGDDAPEVPF